MTYYDLPYFYQQLPMQSQSSYEIIGSNVMKKQIKRTVSMKRPPPPKLIKERQSYSSFHEFNSPELTDHFVRTKNNSNRKTIRLKYENSLKQSKSCHVIKAQPNIISEALTPPESEPGDKYLRYKSSIEKRMRKEAAPIEQPKNVTNEPIPELNLSEGIRINQDEIDNWQGDLKTHKLRVDPNPEVIHKMIPSRLEYEQEIFFKFLRTMLPPDGDIILREEPLRPVPAPPLIVRIPSKEPDSKSDVIHIHERPPTPPAPLPPVVIPVKAKYFPLERKVIKEKIDPLPNVPLSVLIDKWLPYMQGPRRVVLEPNPVLPNVNDTSNPENFKNLTIHFHFNEPVKRFHRINSE